MKIYEDKKSFKKIIKKDIITSTIMNFNPTH